MTYKQPHEDIRGTDRTGDDLLSLDARAVAHREALIVLAGHLRDATLVGNPAPVVARMNERMLAPRIGDFVTETSSRWRRDLDSKIKGTGFLVEKREEWWTTNEEWAAAKAEVPDYTDADRNRSIDEAWYIQYGPDAGDICRWTNCSFIVIPIDRETFAVPAGTRDGTTTVFTRDSLLGSLADSGFQLRVPTTDRPAAPSVAPQGETGDAGTSPAAGAPVAAGAPAQDPDVSSLHADCDTAARAYKPVKCDRCGGEYVCTPSQDFYCAAEGDHCCEPCLIGNLPLHVVDTPGGAS